MIRQFVKGRVAVFIDSANILYSQHALGWKADYKKLKIYIEGECELSKIHFYTGVTGDNQKQILFLGKLRALAYQVRVKEVKKIKTSNGIFYLKGNLDIELALDAYRSANTYDTLLLFSGDSDFSYLVDLLKHEGKSVLVLSTRGHISKELIQRAKYIDLQKLRVHIERKFKGPQ